MVNKEIVRRWVSALRSGKYEQGFGYLNAGGKFCCLGVLCDTLKEELQLNVKCVGSDIQEGDREWVGDLIEYNGEDSFLPAKVARLIEVSASGDLPEELWEKENLYSLIAMNDDGETFDKIADAIERVWLND